MKKFLTGFLALFLSATLCMAQAPAATKKPAKAKTTQQDAKPLKKDGTPDKRFKENKETAGPKKKDGTADLRYKANKKAAKKS